MKNYKGFDFVAAERFVKSYGFESLDPDAFMKLVIVIDIIVCNLMNNVMHVAKALDVKLIKKEHFQAVLAILKSQQIKMSGGRTVLPSEYFGVNSNKYFDNVSSYETPMDVQGLTRNAMEIKLPVFTGGAIELVTRTSVKSLIDAFKQNKNLDVKLSSSAYEIIISSVLSNLKLLLNSCKAFHAKKHLKTKALTLNLLVNTMKNNSKQFAHLSHVWKSM